MTLPEARNLIDQPPGMSAPQVEAALGISEHGRRQLEADKNLTPVLIGRRKVYPRHQVFTLLGMVDPDVAAAEAARERNEAPSEDDASSNLIALDPPKPGVTAHG